MKNLFKPTKTKVLVAAIVILAVVALAQFMDKKSAEYQLVLHRSVPHIDLSNVQFVDNGRYYAYITGFVAFKNEADQPKDMRQYYIIEPTISPKVYTIKEVFAMNMIPPREFDPVMLDVAQDTGSMLVLVDESGNTWSINKLTKEVQMLDSTGDATYLITSNLDYQDFMREFLSK